MEKRLKMLSSHSRNAFQRIQSPYGVAHPNLNPAVILDTEPDFPSFAVGKGNDFFGWIHDFCLIGFEFYVLIFFSDNKVSGMLPPFRIIFPIR